MLARAIILASTMLLCDAWPGQATSIVVIGTPDMLILGADSKIMRGDNTDSRTVCKIGVAKNIMHAESGILLVPLINFRVGDIANSSILESDDLNAAMQRFETAISLELTAIVNALKRGDPANFFTHWEGRPILEAVFMGLQNDVPTVHLRTWVSQSQLTGDVSLRIISVDSPTSDRPSIAVALGQHDAIDGEIRKASIFWDKPTMADFVRHLIEIEMAALPNDVGPPISIVEMGKDGAHWISKGECAPQ